MFLSHKMGRNARNSEYDQEIPQSQTADNPMAPRGRAAQPSRDTRKTNSAKQSALSSPSSSGFRRKLDSNQPVCLFVWFLTTHQPLWVISVRRY